MESDKKKVSQERKEEGLKEKGKACSNPFTHFFW